MLIKNADEIRGEVERLAKVRRFLTFPAHLFLSFPKDRDRKPTSLHSFTDSQKKIAASGIKVIIPSSSINGLALQYLNSHSIVIPKVLSKFELCRLCRVVNATPLDRMRMPTSEVGWGCVQDSRLRRGSRDSQCC